LSSLVKLENVTKVYHTDANDFHALKGIDFQLDRGEMIAIVGASGSGKSTLMNILGFLDHCTTGDYLFDSENVSHLRDEELSKIRNQKIGFVFQSFFLLPRLNALQNVTLPLFYRGVPAEEAEEKSLLMLEKVGMKKFITHKPNQLSGGQQQRVAIARALVGNPEVILADEPTGALDSQTGQEVLDLFIDLNRNEKRTIVIVTHDQGVSNQCQRIVALKDGKIFHQDASEKVREY
jgi:putative ABC transport system ATP-binding protein